MGDTNLERDNINEETGEIDYAAERERDREKVPPLEVLQSFLESDNIAEMLDEDELARLGAKVVEEYGIDVTSRTEWTARNEKAMKLAKQVVEKKNYPWPKASNIKYPLITVAAMQYNARSYSAIVTDDLVKAKVNGYDENGTKQARADRVSKAMSWQCMQQMEEWDEEMDQLLIILPIVGMCFKKTYYDSLLGRNVSELVLADNLVFNYSAKNFYKCPRHTHEIDLYPYEIKEKVTDGVFLHQEFGMSSEGADNDPDATHRFLEQHRLEDLDGDGYPEPYIVTVHRQTAKVVRIRARFEAKDIKESEGEIIRIKPSAYFTKFGFLPNPDGSAHDIGFGVLLGPINVSINRSMNLMFDAGHLANTQGGFIGSGLRMKGGPIRLTPGEYRQLPTNGATIRDNLVPVTFQGPSETLFRLLGFLVEAANDIASIKDVLKGEQKGSNVPASTTLALIEQGLQTHTAINKRVYRSLKKEFKLLYKLNSVYMPPQTYITFLDADTPTEILLDDFRQDDLDISPAADPKVLTNMQAISRAEILLPFAQDPDFDGVKIKLRYLEAVGIPDVQDLLADPKKKAAAGKQQMMLLLENLKNERMKAEATMIKAKAGAVKDQTGAALDLAKAEQEDANLRGEVVYYQGLVDKMSELMETMYGDRKAGNNDAGGVGQLGEQPGNAQVQAVPS